MSRRRFARRVLWIAFVVLAVLVQPAIIAASEVHESEHLLLDGHAFEADGNADDDEGAAGHDAAPDALLHLGLCCGHPTALLPSVLVVVTRAIAAPPPCVPTPAPAGVEPGTLLRPPIAA